MLKNGKLHIIHMIKDVEGCNEMAYELEELAKQEFMNVVNTYMLPLFDARGSIKLKEDASNNSELVSYFEDEKEQRFFRFYPCICDKMTQSPFYCEVGTYSSTAIKKRLSAILREILKVSEYNCFNNAIRKQRNYGTKSCRHDSYKQRTFQLAFEIGMCTWLTSDYKKATVLHSILCRMQEWAGRTYEGKTVPFGLVIDFSVDASPESVSYLHFLENDSSAVFTDGIFSGILLDKNGKLLSFLSRSTPAPENVKNQDMFVPFQFVDIAQHCNKSAIGIIVLTNGEIMLIKNRAVCFAKRGSKWVSFDWERVYVNLRPYFLLGIDKDEESIRNKMKDIYCTLLDVSFSHTGGCLAIVIPDIGTDEISKIIKDRFDLSITGNLPEGVSDESKEKIEVLKYLLVNHNTIRSFFDIEKPLRKEILSLDGATVVSLDGSFYCAGSIVAVPGGSSSGGRAAAAKRLAQMGVGIKVSEDGYIEAFGLPIESKEDNKVKVIPLFKIK